MNTFINAYLRSFFVVSTVTIKNLLKALDNCFENGLIFIYFICYKSKINSTVWSRQIFLRSIPVISLFHLWWLPLVVYQIIFVTYRLSYIHIVPLICRCCSIISLRSSFFSLPDIFVKIQLMKSIVSVYRFSIQMSCRSS